MTEAFPNDVVDKDSRLGESIHATTNFEVDPTIMHMFEKVVFVDDFLRDVAEFYADKLGSVRWSLEAEVADVEGCILGSLMRERTIDYKFEEIKR